MRAEILDNVRAGSEVVVKQALVSCPLCKLELSSCRVLCEHMNAHQNHGWRGMNPPPGVRLEELIEYEVE